MSDAIRDRAAPILTCHYCGHSLALTGPLVESEMEIRAAGGFQCRDLEACDARADRFGGGSSGYTRHEAEVDAIPNRVPPLPPADLPNVYVEKGGFGGGRTESRPPHTTRNSVPTENELAEVMAACWDNPGFRSNREANGYPKMAKALRAYLLERAT